MHHYHATRLDVQHADVGSKLHACSDQNATHSTDSSRMQSSPVVTKCIYGTENKLEQTQQSRPKQVVMCCQCTCLWWLGLSVQVTTPHLLSS